MKIIKRALLWVSIMLVLELIINAAGALMIRGASDTMASSLKGYSKKTEMILHPTVIDNTDEKARTNGLAALAVRAFLSDGRLYNHTKFGYNFLFLNFTMEQSVVFFDENGTTQVSSGIFNIAYEDRGDKTDYIRYPLGLIDVKELCAQSNAKELYSVLEKRQFDSIRLDEYSVDGDFIVRPKKLTFLDSDKNAIQSFEFPCEGEIKTGDCYYIYDVLANGEQMRNATATLYKKMKDVYDGEQKTDKTAMKLMEDADFSQSSQDFTKTSYGFAAVKVKHVETYDGGAMTFALRFNYIKGVILYTIICAVILTAFLLPIWIHKDRKSQNSYY
jgi:hypothetical protein